MYNNQVFVLLQRPVPFDRRQHTKLWPSIFQWSHIKCSSSKNSMKKICKIELKCVRHWCRSYWRKIRCEQRKTRVGAFLKLFKRHSIERQPLITNIYFLALRNAVFWCKKFKILLSIFLRKKHIFFKTCERTGTVLHKIGPSRNFNQFDLKLSAMKDLDVSSHSCNFQLGWFSFTLLSYTMNFALWWPFVR